MSKLIVNLFLKSVHFNKYNANSVFYEKTDRSIYQYNIETKEIKEIYCPDNEADVFVYADDSYLYYANSNKWCRVEISSGKIISEQECESDVFELKSSNDGTEVTVSELMADNTLVYETYQVQED